MGWHPSSNTIGTYLRAVDFDNLLSLEEALHSTLLSQHALYELDLQQMKAGDFSNIEVPLHLSIVSQGNAGMRQRELFLKTRPYFQREANRTVHFENYDGCNGFSS